MHAPSLARFSGGELEVITLFSPSSPLHPARVWQNISRMSQNWAVDGYKENSSLRLEIAYGASCWYSQIETSGIKIVYRSRKVRDWMKLSERWQRFSVERGEEIGVSISGRRVLSSGISFCTSIHFGNCFLFCSLVIYTILEEVALCDT